MKHLLTILFFIPFILCAQNVSFNFTDTYKDNFEFVTSEYVTTEINVTQSFISFEQGRSITEYEILDTLTEKQDGAYNIQYKRCAFNSKIYLVQIVKDINTDLIVSVSVQKNGHKISFYDMNQDRR